MACDDAPDRRALLRSAAALGAAALLAGPAFRARASGKAEALVLSCMDYRLADNVHHLMGSLGLTDRYDHVVLAGASAGATQQAFAGWRETFWSHLDVAISLHGVHRVIVVDHRDCGAYKIAFGPEHAADPAAEFALHAAVIGDFAAAVRARKPDLAVEGWLMRLDGSAEPVPV